MKQWLLIISAWIVSLFTFWKLGEKSGKKDEKISIIQESEKNVANAIKFRNNVDVDTDGVRKKWKRSKK